jgi:hypothetical protein
MSPPNLAQFRLPKSLALHGKTLELAFDDGGAVSLTFTEDAAVAWRATGETVAGHGIDPVDVVQVRPSIFFIDFGLSGFPFDALTLLVSTQTGEALAVHQHRDPSANPAVSHSFMTGRLQDCEMGEDRPRPTREMAGRWHLLRYAPENLYEHIYVNTTGMCSHNLATANTPGRLDCHPAAYWRFSDQLYLMGWRERDSQAAMVVCEDLIALKATGKVLHPMSPTQSGNAPIGGDILPVALTFPSIPFERL